MQWPKPTYMAVNRAKVYSWTSKTPGQRTSLDTGRTGPPRHSKPKQVKTEQARITPGRRDQSTSRRWTRHELEGANRGVVTSHRARGEKAEPAYANLQQAHLNHVTCVINPNPCDQEAAAKHMLPAATSGLEPSMKQVTNSSAYNQISSGQAARVGRIRRKVEHSAGRNSVAAHCPHLSNTHLYGQAGKNEHAKQPALHSLGPTLAAAYRPQTPNLNPCGQAADAGCTRQNAMHSLGAWSVA